MKVELDCFKFLEDPVPSLNWSIKDVNVVLINGEEYLAFPHGELLQKGDYVFIFNGYLIPVKKEEVEKYECK